MPYVAASPLTDASSIFWLRDRDGQIELGTTAVPSGFMVAKKYGAFDTAVEELRSCLVPLEKIGRYHVTPGGAAYVSSSPREFRAKFTQTEMAMMQQIAELHGTTTAATGDDAPPRPSARRKSPGWQHRHFTRA